MAKFSKVTHVIFDVDGLLLDTEKLYTQIMQSVCEPHGKKFTLEIKLEQMGKKEHESAKVLIDELNLPISVDEYLKQVNDQIAVHFPHAELMPGVEKLVRHLHAHGIPMSLATGGDSPCFKIKTQNHTDLFSLFSHAVFSTEDPDVQHGKPAPDCFLVAARRFPNNPDPDKVLVFEDAPNGVRAGLSAGMKVVWVPDALVDKSMLEDQPHLTLDTLEHFKPENFGLPPYGN